MRCIDPFYRSLPEPQKWLSKRPGVKWFIYVEIKQKIQKPILEELSFRLIPSNINNPPKPTSMRGLKVEKFQCISFADRANVYNHMRSLTRPRHSYILHTSTLLDLHIDSFIFFFLHLIKLFMFNCTGCISEFMK